MGGGVGGVLVRANISQPFSLVQSEELTERKHNLHNIWVLNQPVVGYSIMEGELGENQGSLIGNGFRIELFPQLVHSVCMSGFGKHIEWQEKCFPSTKLVWTIYLLTSQVSVSDTFPLDKCKCIKHK